MSAEDADYLQRRAEEEVERARLSDDPIVVHFHYALSELFFERLRGGAEPA
jgi:hypothetical protein